MSVCPADRPTRAGIRGCGVRAGWVREGERGGKGRACQPRSERHEEGATHRTLSGVSS